MTGLCLESRTAKRKNPSKLPRPRYFEITPSFIHPIVEQKLCMIYVIIIKSHDRSLIWDTCRHDIVYHMNGIELSDWLAWVTWLLSETPLIVPPVSCLPRQYEQAPYPRKRQINKTRTPARLWFRFKPKGHPVGNQRICRGVTYLGCWSPWLSLCLDLQHKTEHLSSLKTLQFHCV